MAAGWAPQHEIAREVAVAAVVVAKPVEVEERHGERSAESCGLVAVTLERLLHHAAVGQSGERVAGGQGPEPFPLAKGGKHRAAGVVDRVGDCR